MPEVPANAKLPSDRLKAEAAQADAAEGESHAINDVTFEYEGETYVIDGGFVDDLEILEHLEDEENIKALRKILGKQQWNDWKDRNRNDKGRIPSAPVIPFLRKLFDEVQAGN